ncbi:MAG: Cell wall-binding protein YocH precursor [Firmicutes bacterium ADurb.Bin506]|nr:MAG: Cell wall-binding protein YocH precursor [Firmicutes bacterium ADurb.Bin506]
MRPVRVSAIRKNAILWGLAICLVTIGVGTALGLAARREAAAAVLSVPTVSFTPRTSYVERVLSDAGISLKRQLPPPGRASTGWVDKTIVKRKVAIPNSIQHVNDSRLDKGQTRVVKAGAAGVREQMVLVVTDQYGQRSETVMREWVSSLPEPAVIAVGTRPPLRTLLTSRGSYSYRQVLNMVATAYEPGPTSCGEYANGYTAIGLKAAPGIVAVDPKVIPLRTRLYVEGYGPAIAGDVGGAIKGNRIDLLFETVEECLAYGRRRVKVYILED